MRFAKSPDFAAMLGASTGPNFGDIGNQAVKGQGYLERSAMEADANAAKSDIEADYIKESAQYKAAAAAPQQSGGGFGDILGQVAGIAGGLSGGFGGGVGGFSAGDANVMGMDMNTAKHIGSGGFAETVIGPGGIGPTTLGRW